MKHNQLADKVSENNIILTDDVKLSLDTAQTGKNLNVCVIGSTGTGKTRNYVLPNILQANTSYVITDPNGYLLKETGKFLEEQGYKIKVLNLIDMEHSNHYNPFNYIYGNDRIVDKTTVMKMVNLLLSALKNKIDFEKTFLMDMIKDLISAICFYLVENENMGNCNLKSIIRLLNMPISELDTIFNVPYDEIYNIYNTNYMLFRKSSKEQAESIRIMILNILQEIIPPDIIKLTEDDDMELDLTGNRKTAIFITMSLAQNKLNFLSDMLLTQIFNVLYVKTESLPNNELPVHVRFMLDEFANSVYIPDLEKHLAVCGSHNISVNITLQCIEQLKTLYKYWDIILNNCGSILFFGCHSVETLKCFSDFIGNQISVDQLKTIDTDKCVLNIHDMPTFYGKKFDVENHINYDKLEK